VAVSESADVAGKLTDNDLDGSAWYQLATASGATQLGTLRRSATRWCLEELASPFWTQRNVGRPTIAKSPPHGCGCPRLSSSVTSVQSAESTERWCHGITLYYYPSLRLNLSSIHLGGTNSFRSPSPSFVPHNITSNIPLRPTPKVLDQSRIVADEGPAASTSKNSWPHASTYPFPETCQPDRTTTSAATPSISRSNFDFACTMSPGRITPGKLPVKNDIKATAKPGYKETACPEYSLDDSQRCMRLTSAHLPSLSPVATEVNKHGFWNLYGRVAALGPRAG